MSIGARREYLKAIRVRYQKGRKKQKMLILDEFCGVCKYSRKYAIRILNGQVEPRKSKPGPKLKYAQDFLFHLVQIWRAMGMPCSKKMVAAIPLWLAYYKDERFNEKIKNLLHKVSASTIDRKLKPYREANQKGLSTTRPASSWVKSRIPIELISKKVKAPGYIEADTVSHCGNSAGGQYVSTLTMTDLYTGWTENRALWTKDAEGVLKQIKDVERMLPFLLKGFACDNGTEFLNKSLHRYFRDRKPTPAKFVRRRPYKKNDAAHVEQKNWTHVRQLFGYDRLEDPEMVVLMNEIYKALWNPLLNFFIPTMKLVQKTRIGGKMKKTYDKPQTPYQRLMSSNDVLMGIKQRLQYHFSSLNPFTLRELLDKKVNEFFKLVERRKVGKIKTA